jgi:hypothetical protein
VSDRDGTGDLGRQSQEEADGVTPAGFFFFQKTFIKPNGRSEAGAFAQLPNIACKCAGKPAGKCMPT